MNSKQLTKIYKDYDITKSQSYYSHGASLVKLLNNDNKEMLIQSIYTKLSTKYYMSLENGTSFKRATQMERYSKIHTNLTNNYNTEYFAFSNILKVYSYDQYKPIEVCPIIKKLKGNLIAEMLFIKLRQYVCIPLFLKYKDKPKYS